MWCVCLVSLLLPQQLKEDAHTSHARAQKSIGQGLEMLAMQTNYPSLPSENESTSSTNPPVAASVAAAISGPTSGSGRYASATPTSAPFPGPSAIDASFSRCAPQTNDTSPSLNEVLHRSLMASSFAANDINESVIPRAHSNGKSFDFNALREAASREKKLFEIDSSERKDGGGGMSSYDFPFHMPTAHPQWGSHPDNHPTDLPTKASQAPETDNSASAKLGSFSPNVGMLPYANTGSSKDLDYFLAANAARALVNHLGGAGGASSSAGGVSCSGSSTVPQPSDDRTKSPSTGFRDLVNPQITQSQQSPGIEPLYAHQRSLPDRSSPPRPSFGLPSLGMGGGAPPNMSVPFNSSTLPFSMPPHFRQNNPSYSPHPSSHLLQPNPFGGLDPGFADRMKEYSAPHHLMDARYPGAGSMSRLPRSASPMDGDRRVGGMIGDSAMSDASPNSSSSGKFVSPHNQTGGATGNGGNIVLYPWMNPKSCGK